MIIGGLPWSLWGMRSGEESQLCCFLRMLFRWEEFPSSLPLPPLQLPPSSPPPSLPVPTLYSWSREVWKENTAVRISCCSHHQHHRVQSRCVRGVDQDWQWWHQHWGRGGQMSANNSGKTASVLTTYSLTEKVSTNITFSQKKGSTSSSTDATSNNYWQSTLVNTKTFFVKIPQKILIQQPLMKHFVETHQLLWNNCFFFWYLEFSCRSNGIEYLSGGEYWFFPLTLHFMSVGRVKMDSQIMSS